MGVTKWIYVKLCDKCAISKICYNVREINKSRVSDLSFKTVMLTVK